jgi:hypothetical protein
MTESPFRCAPPSRGRGRDGVVLQAIRPARPVSPESRAMGRICPLKTAGTGTFSCFAPCIGGRRYIYVSRDGVHAGTTRPSHFLSGFTGAQIPEADRCQALIISHSISALTERPFTLLPDPDFLYWSPAHKRAFSVLEYGVMTRAPITVITGEVGPARRRCCKTPDRFDETTVVGLISNATGNRGELLQWVLNALDVPCEKDAAYVTMFQTLQDFVIGQYSQNNHVVLIIDEAQNLSIEGLEELRMLTNINSNKDELLQLILMGQPELAK